VAPGWLGVAAAAGLVVGVIGGQLTARINPPPAPVQPAAATTAPAQETDRAPIIASWVDPEDVDAFMPQSLHPLNEMTPRVVMASAR
jgi:hypothetical protein